MYAGVPAILIPCRNPRRGMPAQIGHARPSRAVDQDVRRLDVPMDQPAHVCMVECLGNRRRPLRSLAHRGPPLLEPRSEVAPLDVLRDHVTGRVLGAANVINRNDVRVVEPGEHPRFGQIRFGILGSGDAFRIGNLDRHTPIEVGIMRADRPGQSSPHPAGEARDSGRSQPDAVEAGRRPGGDRRRALGILVSVSGAVLSSEAPPVPDEPMFVVAGTGRF